MLQSELVKFVVLVLLLQIADLLLRFLQIYHGFLQQLRLVLAILCHLRDGLLELRALSPLLLPHLRLGLRDILLHIELRLQRKHSAREVVYLLVVLFFLVIDKLFQL